MNQKIIFFDIDGTIIGEDSKTMLKSTKEAILTARKNGHICMINTGRTQKLVGRDITGLVEFDGYLYGCGTMVVYHDKVLLHETISVKLAEKIIAALRKYKIDAVLEGSENNFINSYERIHTDYFREFVNRFHGKGFGSYEDAPGKFDKFYAYTPDKQSMEKFQMEFIEELDFIDREQGFYEITPKGYSKATGIRHLTEKLHMSMADTVAIGDSNNDIPMLQCADISIAMGNASAEVREMADYVTSDVEEDGIQNALEWLGVLEKEGKTI